MQIPLSIILIEDNISDIELFKYILKDFVHPYNFTSIDQFEDAKTYITSLQSSLDHQQKRLVFIDLNLRSMDGIALLKLLKEHPLTAPIPVIVTTTSESDLDIIKSYKNHANCYLVKSSDFETYRDKTLKTLEYWTETSVLPYY